MYCWSEIYWHCIVPIWDRVVAEARQKKLLEEIERSNSNSTIEILTDVLESVYEGTSAAGVQYSPIARQSIVGHISAARQLLAYRRGEPGVVVIEEAQGGWPFDAEGKVKL